MVDAANSAPKATYLGISAFPSCHDIAGGSSTYMYVLQEHRNLTRTYGGELSHLKLELPLRPTNGPTYVAQRRIPDLR